MDKPILVTGGTNILGRLVVARLREAGRDVRALSRHGDAGSNGGVEFVTGDLATGAGVEAAVDGDRGHRALRRQPRRRRRHDAEPGSRSIAERFPASVYISVVGADRIPVRSRVHRAMFGYFGSKLAAEQVVTGSGIPWTTLRATQFQQSFLAVARGMAKMPVIPVPRGFRFQPIDAARSRRGSPDRPSPSPPAWSPKSAGRRCSAWASLIRIYLEATHQRRLMASVPTIGGAAAAVRAGANLTPDGGVGRTTWQDFVAGRVGRAGEMVPARHSSGPET